MAYALQSLLRIRTMREDRAAGELTAAKQAVAAAADALSARERELRAYRETREERRDRIYATVMGRAVSRDELDLVTEGVSRIDEEGVLKADNVNQAKRILHEKEELESQARGRFTVATKNRMKIDEHRAVWVADEMKADEARAETELEDFVARKDDDD